MKVVDLKELISELPDDMDVVMLTGHNMIQNACFANSEVVILNIRKKITDKDGEEQEAFLLVPCTCNDKEDHEKANLN